MKDSSVQKSTARILLVDDVGSGLIARKSVLEELGHQITIASTPADAMDQFAAKPFDMVVTDFKMPSMNGIELIARLRRIRQDIPVILISGFTDALGLDEATTGADAVIQKSAQEVAQLIRSVNRLLRRPVRKPPQNSGHLQKPGAKKKA